MPSCYTAILSINHKCKLSCKRQRNLKGISDCTRKMPVLVSKGDWKCWKMFDLQLPVQLAKILDVYTSMKNSFPRHHNLSSGKVADIVSSQPCSPWIPACHFMLTLLSLQWAKVMPFLLFILTFHVSNEVWWMNVLELSDFQYLEHSPVMPPFFPLPVWTTYPSRADKHWGTALSHPKYHLYLCLKGDVP